MLVIANSALDMAAIMIQIMDVVVLITFREVLIGITKGICNILVGIRIRILVVSVLGVQEVAMFVIEMLALQIITM